MLNPPKTILRNVAAALCVAVVAVTVGACDRRVPAAEPFVIDVLNGFTPVKDQGNDPTCWAYAMLAAIETTHIGQGDSVHLSVDYAVRGALDDAFVASYLAQGRRAVPSRGMSSRLLRSIERHGLVGYDAYSAPPTCRVAVLARRLHRLATASATARTGLKAAIDRRDAMLDDAMGPRLRRVYMLGAEYTPQEFARSVCAPGEYEALTSFTHHPFDTAFALEVPDNYCGDEFLNVPLDTLVRRVVRAVRAGRGVCWEGDVSEPGFRFDLGVARLHPDADVSERSRQRAFERFATTDDHCMAIVGLAHSQDGEPFFIMKNSWGTHNPYGGLMFVSMDYFRMKTIAVFV